MCESTTITTTITTQQQMSLSEPATEVTQEYATAMEEAIESTTKAEAEVNRLKRKYEPDEPEVRLDKILHLQAAYDHAFMRVQIFTGEKMELTLIPNTRNNGMSLPPSAATSRTAPATQHLRPLLSIRSPAPRRTCWRASPRPFAFPASK